MVWQSLGVSNSVLLCGFRIRQLLSQKNCKTMMSSWNLGPWPKNSRVMATGLVPLAWQAMPLENFGTKRRYLCHAVVWSGLISFDQMIKGCPSFSKWWPGFASRQSKSPCCFIIISISSSSSGYSQHHNIQSFWLKHFVSTERGVSNI